MNTKGSFSNISQEARGLIEGDILNLEDVKFIIDEFAFLVITKRIKQFDKTSPNVPSGVIKFSEHKHSIPVSETLQLGTSGYYQKYEGPTVGVADKQEGLLVESGPYNEVFGKYGCSYDTILEDAKCTLQWSAKEFLIFSTSIAPRVNSLSSLEQRYGNYDFATYIPDPASFAMQLGVDVGKQFPEEALRLEGVDFLIKAMVQDTHITHENGSIYRRGLDTRLLVTHGPVTYHDRPELIVNRFPMARRAEVVPFVKRRQFAWQKEYRFVIYQLGEPQCTRFLMPVTDELRNLACPYPPR